METDIIAYKEKEKFTSYQISQLINSNFNRKPQNSRIFILTSPTRPPPAITSSTFGPLALV